MNATSSLERATTASEVLAAYVERGVALDAARPSVLWERAQPVTFCKDWRGENADSGLQTQVQVLWSDETLYVRFECRYRELFLFEDSQPNGRRHRLWDRDVAEVFLQPDPSQISSYKEFEISPNGMWIDLDISQELVADLKSGLQRSTFLDKKRSMWSAELAIPMNALTSELDPLKAWRVNFFRIEGSSEPRTYHAWKPTMTVEPDFHVPDVFGELRFAAPR